MFEFTYLLFFLRWCARRIELADILFGLDAILFDCKLFPLWCCIEFSLLPCKLLLTITRDAPSKRSFRLSPTKRKFGKRIQHVFTVHEPDIPWHLHSWRISDWTCCKLNEKKRKKINKILISHLDVFLNRKWSINLKYRYKLLELFIPFYKFQYLIGSKKKKKNNLKNESLFHWITSISWLQFS